MLTLNVFFKVYDDSFIDKKPIKSSQLTITINKTEIHLDEIKTYLVLKMSKGQKEIFFPNMICIFSIDVMDAKTHIDVVSFDQEPPIILQNKTKKEIKVLEVFTKDDYRLVGLSFMNFDLRNTKISINSMSLNISGSCRLFPNLIESNIECVNINIHPIRFEFGEKSSVPFVLEHTTIGNMKIIGIDIVSSDTKDVLKLKNYSNIQFLDISDLKFKSQDVDVGVYISSDSNISHLIMSDDMESN